MSTCGGTATAGKYVIVGIGLAPVRDGTGPARLVDVVEGRSTQAVKAWLAGCSERWREQVEVIASDGFTGLKSATTEELPDATPCLNPFHVVRLAGDAPTSAGTESNKAFLAAAVVRPIRCSGHVGSCISASARSPPTRGVVRRL